MTDQTQIKLPDGVLVSADAGTPSAVSAARRLGDAAAGADEWAEALEALEFAAVVEEIAERAAGELGAASVRGRSPRRDPVWIREELLRVEELARLAREGKVMVAEPVPALAPVLARLRIGGSVLDGPELLAVRRTLTAARVVMGELRRVLPWAPHLASLELPAPDKAFERRLEQALDDDATLRDTASPGLAAARSDIRSARERLVQKLEAILRATGAEAGVTLREGRYVIPVPRDLRGRPEGLVHGESASGATLYLEPTAAIELGNALREAESRAAREELRIFRELTDMLRPAHAELEALHAACVALDDLVARARWAVDVDGHAPQVSAAPAELRIVNGRHPLLLAGSAGPPGPASLPSRATEPSSRRAEPPSRPDVVPFDLTLEGNERCVLLSGPNTGGKSVLLKAVGLSVALTQSGIIPPIGPGSALPVFTRVYADIGDRQSIAASLSTFSAHITALRVILDEADDETLVLIDEIGGGTDPAEGGALAGAALIALTRRGAITLATTHLGALKRLATVAPGIVNASLQFDAATLQPTYRLLKGVPGRSYGLAIARRLGLREDVLADAETQVPEAERNLDALLSAVEQRERELRAREQELSARLSEVESRAAAQVAREETQALRDKALHQRERAAEKAAREQARSYLLEAREKVEAAIRQAAAGDDAAAREARRAVEAAAAAEAAALRSLEEADRRTGGAADGMKPGARVRMASGSVGEFMELRGD
jgi:DNA mismatch repair protein MutS2